MNLGQMERYAYDRMGVASPPWSLQLRVLSQLKIEHRRVVAEEKLNHTRADLPFVADDPLVALPADFLEVRALQRGGTVMREVSDHDFAVLTATNSVSSTSVAYDGPMVYIMEEPLRIRVLPAPTTSVALGAVLWYVARVAVMAVAADVPAGIPEEWHPLLPELVLAKFGQKDIRQDAMLEAENLRRALHNHVSERTGDDTYRIKLRGYLGR